MEHQSRKFLDLVSNSTIHGIHNLVKSSNSISKLSWVIIIIISFFANVYLIKSSIDDYFKYEVITKINLLHEDVPEFPGVSICSFNEDPNFNYIKACTFNNRNCSEYLVKEKNCFRFNSGFFRNGTKVQLLKSFINGQGLKLEMESSLYADNFYQIHVSNQSNDPDEKSYVRVGNGVETNLLLR